MVTRLLFSHLGIHLLQLQPVAGRLPPREQLRCPYIEYGLVAVTNDHLLFFLSFAQHGARHAVFFQYSLYHFFITRQVFQDQPQFL